MIYSKIMKKIHIRKFTKIMENRIKKILIILIQLMIYPKIMEEMKNKKIH